MIKQWTASEMGRKGGKISRRQLTPSQARAMVQAREYKKNKVLKPTPLKMPVLEWCPTHPQSLMINGVCRLCGVKK